MNEPLADFESHRIEGFTHEGGHHFSVPLFTQVGENLWVGGCPPREGVPQFNTIVDLYDREWYQTQSGQLRLAVKLFDSHDLPEYDMLVDLAVFVRAAMRRGPVLIHCQAGLNRSNLLTTMVLMAGGMKPADAIAMLREKRCDAVLCNKAFEAYLLSLGGE